MKTASESKLGFSRFLAAKILLLSLFLNLSIINNANSSVRSASCFYMSYGQVTTSAIGASATIALNSNCSSGILSQVRYLNISYVVQGIPIGFFYVQGPIKTLPINLVMSLNFSLLSAGTYPAFIQVLDDSGFIWQSPAGNISVPKGSAGGSSSKNSAKYVCVSAANFDTSCSPYPEWSFQFCSTHGTGVLQELSGNKWKNRWKVDVGEDLDSCDEEYPFFIELNGSTSLPIGKKGKYRVFFRDSQTKVTFSQNFTVTVKRG